MYFHPADVFMRIFGYERITEMDKNAITVNQAECISEKTVRASSLNIAKICPAAPRELLGRNVKENCDPNERPKSEALKRGHAAHKFLEIAITENIMAAEMWMETECEYKDMIYEMKGFVQWLVSDFPFKILCASGYGGRGFCEDEFVWNNDLLQITGHIDYYYENDDSIELIDWKYGEGQKYILYPIEEDYQLMAYALMLNKEYDKPVNLYRVRVSDREYDFIRYDDFGPVEAKVLKVAEAVVNNPDNHNTGQHCSGCLARNTCSAWLECINLVKDLLILDSPGKPVLTKEQATKWALYRGSVKGRIKQLDDALDDAVANGVTIESNGKFYKKITYNTDVITKPRELIAIAKEMGLDPDVKISKKAIGEACKKVGENPKAVFDRAKHEGAVIVTQTSRYGWKK